MTNGGRDLLWKMENDTNHGSFSEQQLRVGKMNSVVVTILRRIVDQGGGIADHRDDGALALRSESKVVYY